MSNVSVELLANRYGNVDLTDGGPPDGYVHVEGQRLGPLCERLGIPYAGALVAWRPGRGRWPARPVLDGVVVSADSAPRLLEVLRERQARSERRALRARERRQAEERRFEAEVRVAADWVLEQGLADDLDSDLRRPAITGRLLRYAGLLAQVWPHRMAIPPIPPWLTQPTPAFSGRALRALVDRLGLEAEEEIHRTPPGPHQLV